MRLRKATRRHLEGLSKALFNHSFKPYLYSKTVYIRFIRRIFTALCETIYTDTDTDTVASTNIRPYIYAIYFPTRSWPTLRIFGDFPAKIPNIHRVYMVLANHINMQCLNISKGSIAQTVIYNVHTRFWPTLEFCKEWLRGERPLRFLSKLEKKDEKGSTHTARGQHVFFVQTCFMYAAVKVRACTCSTAGRGHKEGSTRSQGSIQTQGRLTEAVCDDLQRIL